MLVNLASFGYKKNVLADTRGANNKILKARGSKSQEVSVHIIIPAYLQLMKAHLV